MIILIVFFSKYLCGFRTGHSTQHCLLFMLENLKKSLGKGLKTGILLTDLSKAFDSISHDLLNFNCDKRHVLTLGKLENIRYTHRYSIYQSELEHVFEERDLGVTIDMALNFEEHISSIIAVAQWLRSSNISRQLC